MLNEKEKKELKELAKSPELKEDMHRLSETRYNPFVIKGKVDIDKFLIFLSEYNHFINHTPRTFRRIIDEDIRL